MLVKGSMDGKIELREALDELNACGFRLSKKVRDFVLSKVENKDYYYSATESAGTAE